METAQKRPVPFSRWIVVTLAAAALIAALGLLAAIDTFELPVIGGNETTVDTRDDAPTWNPPTDRGPGASTLSSVGRAGGDQATTMAGHRHQVYLDEGYQVGSNVARPAGSRSIPVERSTHRYFLTEFEPAGEDGGMYLENSRIGLEAD